MALDLMEAYQTEVLAGFNRMRTSAESAMARQRDAADQDMRLITGTLAGALVSADDPQQAMGYNMGARIPITLDTPSNPAKA